jgi:hypothetical protein
MATDMMEELWLIDVGMKFDAVVKQPSRPSSEKGKEKREQTRGVTGTMG